MSQGTLSEKIGVTRNCIQQMECYEHLPQLYTLFELMKALEFKEYERKDFMGDILSAYYKDKEVQKERERQLAESL